MGPGQAVRDLNETDIDGVPIHVKKGISLTLTDERPISQKKQDESNEWFHPIYGNVLDEETIKKFEDELGDDQIDFFICRPVGGLKYMPMAEHQLNAILFYDLVNTVYKKTSNNGVLLLQFDSSWGNILEEWVAHLNAVHPGSADIAPDPRKKEYLVMKLIKQPEENLVQLPGEKVRALFRSSRNKFQGFR